MTDTKRPTGYRAPRADELVTSSSLWLAHGKYIESNINAGPGIEWVDAEQWAVPDGWRVPGPDEKPDKGWACQSKGRTDGRWMTQDWSSPRVCSAYRTLVHRAPLSCHRMLPDGTAEFLGMEFMEYDVLDTTPTPAATAHRVLADYETIRATDEYGSGPPCGWSTFAPAVGKTVANAILEHGECDGRDQYRRAIRYAPAPHHDYRLLDQGERVQADDEFWSDASRPRRWKTTRNTLGEELDGCLKYRRKLTPTPAPEQPTVANDIQYRELTPTETIRAGDEYWRRQRQTWSPEPTDVGSCVGGTVADERAVINDRDPSEYDTEPKWRRAVRHVCNETAWRYLDVGENIQADDQVHGDGAGWWRIIIEGAACIGDAVAAYGPTYRRYTEPAPTPAGGTAAWLQPGVTAWYAGTGWCSVTEFIVDEVGAHAVSPRGHHQWHQLDYVARTRADATRLLWDEAQRRLTAVREYMAKIPVDTE